MLDEFHSNRKDVSIATCEFNSTLTSITTLSSSVVLRTRKHKNVFGELDCQNNHKDKKIWNECPFTSRSQPRNITGRKKYIKILHIV